MNTNLEIINYIDDISEKREQISMYLSNQSKIDVIMHPFKNISYRFKLKKIDSIDNQFTMLVSSSLNKDDYNKSIKTFIKTHPLQAKGVNI